MGDLDDKFERGIKSVKDGANGFIKAQLGKTYEELTPEEKELFNQFTQKSVLHVELSPDAAKGIMASHFLANALMSIIMRHEELITEITPRILMAGLTLSEVDEETKAAVEGIRRQGKLLIMKTIDLYKAGTLAQEVAKLNVEPSLGTIRDADPDEELDD